MRLKYNYEYGEYEENYFKGYKEGRESWSLVFLFSIYEWDFVFQ